MKICHIITRMIVGGAQENTLFSVRGAVEAGHEAVLVTGPSPGAEGELLARVSFPGLKVVVCPHLVRELSPYHDLMAYFFLKKYLSSERFDVVHTHSSKAGIAGRLAARAAGIPLVVHTIHGLAFHRFEKPWKNALYIAAEKFAAKRCDRIYAVAQAMIDQSLAARIGKKEQYKVVYSGMELKDFQNAKPEAELRNQLGIPPDSIVLATLARLFPLKGYEDFIPLALNLAEKDSRYHFLLIGDGLLTESVKRRIAERGMTARFSFAGLVAPSEVHRYLALSDLLVHLSLREGLPRAAVQALACGKPVVAYALDGTPEVVRNGRTGFLADAGDVAAVTRAVESLADHPEQRAEYGRNGKELVSGLFDWRRMSDILLDDYQKSLNPALEKAPDGVGSDN